MNQTVKRIIAGAVTVCLIGGAAGGGLWFWKQHRQKANPVEVQSVMMLAEYNWGGESYTYGMATSDFVQEVFPDAEKIIDEVLVAEGDPVAKGDPLIRYQTEKLELDVEQAEHDLAQVNYDIEKTTNELARVRRIRPYVPAPEPVPEPEPEPEPLPEPEAELCQEVNSLSQAFAGTGTQDDPYRFLCTADCRVDPVFLQTLLGLQRAQTPQKPEETEPSSEEPTSKAEPTSSEEPTSKAEPTSSGEPSSEPESSSVEESSSEETPSSESEPSSEEESTPEEETSPSSEEASEEASTEEESTPEEDTAPASDEGAAVPGIRVASAGTAGFLTRAPKGTKETEPDYFTLTDPVCVRFEVHEGDNENLPLLYAWGIDAERGIYFEPEEIPEYEEPVIEPFVPFVPDYPAEMYTAEELAQMIRELEQSLTDLEHAKRTAELTLEAAQRSLDSATVVSRVDGVVKTCVPEEDVLGTGQPFLVVGADQGFFVNGYVSESLLETVGVGSTVVCSSWETGETYFGEIIEISPYPLDAGSSGGYYGGGNPNSSQYAFTALLEDAESVRNGMYLDIQLDTGGEMSENFYIPRMFIREDGGVKYVFAAGEDGKLHRRDVVTGGTLWGEYREIRSGLSMEDYIAFPYGKNVKEGAPVKMPEDAEFPDDPGFDPGIDPGFDPAMPVPPEDGGEWPEDGGEWPEPGDDVWIEEGMTFDAGAAEELTDGIVLPDPGVTWGFDDGKDFPLVPEDVTQKGGAE